MQKGRSWKGYGRGAARWTASPLEPPRDNDVMIEAYFAGVARIEATIGVEDRASNREAKALHSFEGGLKLLRSKASL
jgi:hypothetical protein